MNDIHCGEHRGGNGRGEIGGVYLALSAGAYNTTLLACDGYIESTAVALSI
jgi:hypothetical protein